MDKIIWGFVNLNCMEDKRSPVDIDTGRMVYECAFGHKEMFNIDDFVPTAHNFWCNIILLDMVVDQCVNQDLGE